jgi:hypothetical protein
MMIRAEGLVHSVAHSGDGAWAAKTWCGEHVFHSDKDKKDYIGDHLSAHVYNHSPVRDVVQSYLHEGSLSCLQCAVALSRGIYAKEK